MLLGVISSFKFTAAPLTRAAWRQMPFHVASYKTLAAGGKADSELGKLPADELPPHDATNKGAPDAETPRALFKPSRAHNLTAWRAVVRPPSTLELHLKSRCISSGLRRCRRSHCSLRSCGETFISFPTRTHMPSISVGVRPHKQLGFCLFVLHGYAYFSLLGLKLLLSFMGRVCVNIFENRQQLQASCYI